MIVGSAVGHALEGGRALVELMYCDFMGRAGDEIFNQLAKWQSMSACILRDACSSESVRWIEIRCTAFRIGVRFVVIFLD